MAGPLSPLVLAIGAAAATATIVVGVVAGPGIANCVSRGDFGECLRETFITGAALDPAPATPVAVAGDEEPSEQEPVGEQAAPEPEPIEVVAAPDDETEPEAEAPDVEAAASVPAEETPAPAAAHPPTIALVRVAPDGSAVIAGSATPEAGVALFANEDPVGETHAERSGDWVFVTETPLPHGGVELRVQDAETGLFASSTVVAVVQEDGVSEPLVVASEPGQASEILQGLGQRAPRPPAAPAADDTPQPVLEPAAPQPADAAVEADPIPDPVVEAASEPETAAPAPAAPSEAPIETAARSEETAIADTPEPASPEPPQEGPDAADAAEQAEEAAPVPDPQAPAAPSSGDTLPPQVAQPAEPAPAETARPAPAAGADTDAQTEISALPPAAAPAAEPPPVSSAIAVSIDAIEVDGVLNFFAGGGMDGTTVRLYVDNAFVADGLIADGRWLIEAREVLTQARQRVRVDMLGEDGSVIGRAEVNFVLDVPDLPEPEIPESIVVAEREVPETPAPEATEQAPTGNAAPAVADEAPRAEPLPETPAPDAAPQPAIPDEPAPAQPAPAPVDPAPQTPPAAPEVEPLPVPPSAPDTPIEAPAMDRESQPEQPAAPAVEPAPTPAAPEPISEPAPAPDTAREEPPLAPDVPAAPDPQPGAAPADPEPAREDPRPEPAPSDPASVPPDAAAPEGATAPPPSPGFAEPAGADDESIPTMVGVRSGVDDRIVSGRAIIRRGDNLWTIARRVYGQGIRYTQIYDANLGQIRNPDLIYPGQVFDLPDTDAVIGEEEG